MAGLMFLAATVLASLETVFRKRLDENPFEFDNVEGFPAHR
jgi:hypothetical protein